MNVTTRILILVCGILPAISVLAEDGVTDTAIIFGSSLPFTGEIGKRGLEYQTGTDLALKKINSQGGVNGKKIEIRALDDGYLPQKSVENVRGLVEKDKVFGLFQVLGTPSVKAIEPLLSQKKIPLVAPLTGGISFRVPANPYIFAIRPGFNAEAKVLADFLAKKGSKNIGYFYQDDSLGSEGKTAVTQALTSHGLKRNAEASYKRGTLETEAAIATFKKAGVDTVIMWATEKPTTNFIQKAVEAGLKVSFFGCSVSLGPDSLSELANIKAEVFFTQPNAFFATKQSTILKNYTEDAKLAGQNPNANGFEAYMNTSFLAEALKRTGANLNRAEFIKAIENMASVNIGGLDFTFSATDHEGLADVFIGKVDGKKLTIIQ